MQHSIQTELKAASAQLSEAGVESPLLDAQLIMAQALRRPRLYVIAHPEHVLSDTERTRFSDMIEARRSRRPLAYILGRKEFYGLDLEVRPGVLVPRPETEVLVEDCLKRMTGRERAIIADVGTGSGAVAVALAANLTSAQVYATEVSRAALQVAQANVEKHSLSDRVVLLEGSMLAPLAELGMLFDAIVSNPPYISTAEIDTLQPEIKDYEPVDALDGGPDGLDSYRALVPGALELLREDGFLAVEVGAGQADAVRRMANNAGYRNTETARDLAGIERVVVAFK